MVNICRNFRLLSSELVNISSFWVKKLSKFGVFLSKLFSFKVKKSLHKINAMLKNWLILPQLFSIVNLCRRNNTAVLPYY